METQDLCLQHANALCLNKNTRWLEPLVKQAHFKRGHPQASIETASESGLRAIPIERGLRTVIAVLPEQFQAAEQLVRRRYAWRGYHLASADNSWFAPLDSGCTHVTLLAEDDGKLLGTLTVRPDSPQGLLAEQSYGAEIESLRRQGRRVAELIKLAVEKGADWKATLDALVQSTYFLTRVVHAVTDVLIEVNPRHVVFYQKVFGFVVAAAERLCARVGAPSVLMKLDLEQFARRLQLSYA